MALRFGCIPVPVRRAWWRLPLAIHAVIIWGAWIVDGVSSGYMAPPSWSEMRRRRPEALLRLSTRH